MSPEKTLLDLILDAMRKLELPPNQAFCRQVGLMLFLSPVRIIDWDWDALHVLMRTCGCHFSRDVAIMGLPDRSWGVKTAGRRRSLLRSSCWNPSKFNRCWETIIFYSQMKYFFDFSMFSCIACIHLGMSSRTDRVYFCCFIVRFPRSLKSTASAVLVHYTWDARSTTQRPCKRSGKRSSQFRVPKAWTCYDILWFKWRIQCPWLSQFWPILSMMIHESLEISMGAIRIIRFVDPHRPGEPGQWAGLIGRPWCCLCSDWKKLAMWWVAWRPFGNGLPQFWAQKRSLWFTSS